jgi:hypothetical protein
VLTPGLYRVVERDAPRPTTREWRLTAGETLTLRPGDELTVEAGSRLRFEAGRRVPGAPASGVVWADASAGDLRMLPAALGALTTLLGGALALVAAPARTGLSAGIAPLALLASVGAAVTWGVYGAATAPDLTLGGALPAPLLKAPTLALGAAGAPLTALALVAVAALLLSAALALRERLVEVAGGERVVWIVAVLAGAALTAWPFDPWSLLMLALGVAAAGWAPARLAPSRPGGLAGAIVGGATFAALAALPALSPAAPAWLEALARYPAVVALPLGWAATRAFGGADPRRGGDGR